MPSWRWSVGLGLGLAGAEMQTIRGQIRWASPFTLGISSAAAFGASLALVLDLSLPGLPPGWAVAGNAFLFAILSAVLLDVLARWGGMSGSGMVLVGIALVFTFNALVSLMQYIASAEDLQNLVFWTMGSLSRAPGQGGRHAAGRGRHPALLPEGCLEAHRAAAGRGTGTELRHRREAPAAGLAAAHQFSGGAGRVDGGAPSASSG